ncbi:MAG: RsmD family RNA methyltransferase [Treponema sp.]|jgi:16S rRNA (guanine(966)-N(2))-methyltransferase RsmD|nr:RsmD family RNA methyltransferase [Treponema sp.]
MRITGGSLCGCQVATPGGVIRPAMDRMRESVFATLGDLTGCSFLDIFSGSGVIALEAASRGASFIEAVENDPLKRKTLLRNAALSPVRIQCRFMPAELYVQRAKRSFDVIFCDPPFPYEYKWILVKAIANSALMKRDARLLIHRPQEDFLYYAIDNLMLKRTKKYGRSVVDFFVFSC